MWKLGERNVPWIISDSTFSQVPTRLTPPGVTLIVLWPDPSPQVSASFLGPTGFPKNAYYDYDYDCRLDGLSVGTGDFLCANYIFHLEDYYLDPDDFSHGLYNSYLYIYPIPPFVSLRGDASIYSYLRIYTSYICRTNIFSYFFSLRLYRYG